MPDKRQPDERWPHFSPEYQNLLNACYQFTVLADESHSKLGFKPSQLDIETAEALAAISHVALVNMSSNNFINHVRRFAKKRVENENGES